VDILNILGLSMLAAAVLWGLAKTRAARIALFVAAAAAVAAVAPAVRASTAIAAWPDPLEWYFQPWTGKSSFTLSPWPAFLFAGVAVGEWLEGVRTAPEEQRATWQLGALGAVLVAIGYAATFFPPVYDNNALWTVAPSFVGLRLGILLMALPAALALAVRGRRHPVLEEFGVSSLFVYWIHVEMVYGIASMSLHRKLTVPQAAVGYVLLCVLLFALVRLKNRVRQGGLKTALYIPTWPTRPT
ncbi:MAG TPA: acyltransferase family protein, partial [Vicinamibacterales bacterium]|nr:acyltransferase family protein [Vicinamibacterales bacterium]